jgi:homopolymeric O-antigen transport system permease protein
MSATAGLPERVIEPGRRFGLPDLRELWEYRDLAYFLARRDVSVRYKQTAIGAVWAVLQPLSLAVVFSVFLGLLAHVPSRAGIQYPLFALSGMVMWLYIVQALSRTSNSTVDSSQLISKVYFPRMVIPIAAVVPPLIEFAIAFVVVLVAMVIYGHPPQWEILLVPLPVMLAVAVALGFGLWLSALHVRFRDVALLVPFMIQVGLFITPIVYPLAIIPHHIQWLYALNPAVGVLEVYRWCLFPGAGGPAWYVVAVPVVASIFLIVTGAMYFARAEREFADVI